ncbi:MAG: NAC domain-containing protein [Candidatus Aenigmatarchaeota archaeon]
MIFKKKTDDEKIKEKGEKMQKMMEKFGITSKRVDADIVEIRGKDIDVIIEKPEIMITNVMGRDVYQITGDSRKSPLLNEHNHLEDDVKIVMDQTGEDRDTVVNKLQELDFDLAKTIGELKRMRRY